MPVKADFIATIRKTPEGISDFLTTPIPAAPSMSTPADVDAAIIANGIAAKFMLDLFAPYAGLTPIELLLRIGQHNNVLEAGLLAGLEYRTGATGDTAQHGFEVVEPAEGQAYTPGNLRVQVQPRNGDVQQVAVETTGAAPVALDREADGSFWGFLRLEEVGDYLLTFAALFSDETTQTATVTVTIAEVVADPAPGQTPPGNPEGEDFWPVDTAKKAFDKAYKTAARALSSKAEAAKVLTEAAAAAAQKMLDQIKTNVGKTISGLSALAGAIAAVVGKVASRAADGEPSVDIYDDLLYTLADLQTATESAYSAASLTYFKNNPHSAGGYTSCPETLAGAADAMNEKYGAGTVSY